MGGGLTQGYLDALWSRIEELEDRLVKDPNDRGAALLLSACLDNYNAKLKLLHMDRCDN